MHKFSSRWPGRFVYLARPNPLPAHPHVCNKPLAITPSPYALSILNFQLHRTERLISAQVRSGSTRCHTDICLGDAALALFLRRDAPPRLSPDCGRKKIQLTTEKSSSNCQPQFPLCDVPATDGLNASKLPNIIYRTCVSSFDILFHNISKL